MLHFILRNVYYVQNINYYYNQVIFHCVAQNMYNAVKNNTLHIKMQTSQFCIANNHMSKCK